MIQSGQNKQVHIAINLTINSCGEFEFPVWTFKMQRFMGLPTKDKVVDHIL